VHPFCVHEELEGVPGHKKGQEEEGNTHIAHVAIDKVQEEGEREEGEVLEKDTVDALSPYHRQGDAATERDYGQDEQHVTQKEGSDRGTDRKVEEGFIPVKTIPSQVLKDKTREKSRNGILGAVEKRSIPLGSYCPKKHPQESY
jgi:hypothetical protein